MLEEQSKVESLDKRCFQLFGILTIVLTVLGAIAVIKSESLFEPAIPVEWIKLVAFLIAAFALVCAWGHSLLVLKIGNTPELPKEDQTSSSNRIKEDNNQNQLIADYYLEAIEKLSEASTEKVRYMAIAYEEITMSAWFLGIVTAIAVGVELLD